MDTKKESPLFKTMQMWSEGETKLLLDRYVHYLPDIGPLKMLKNKKEMWIKISSEIEGKSPKQYEERYKTVIRRKKAAVENNNTSGTKRQKVDFESELDEICNDSIEPGVQISSQKDIRKSCCEENVVKCEKIKPKTVQETLLDIAQKKEEAREKRHKEKKDSLDKIHILLAKMLENKYETKCDPIVSSPDIKNSEDESLSHPDAEVVLPHFSKKRTTPDESLPTYSKKRRTSESEKEFDSKKENPTFSYFGQSVSAQLADLPEEEAFPAMAEIQNMLVARKMKTLNKQNLNKPQLQETSTSNDTLICNVKEEYQVTEYLYSENE